MAITDSNTAKKAVFSIEEIEYQAIATGRIATVFFSPRRTPCRHFMPLW